MLHLKAKFISIKELPPNPGFASPTVITTVLGPGTGESLNLVVADADTGARLAALSAPMADVTLKLAWHKVSLASLGGSGRGNAYRLRVTGIQTNVEEVAR